MTKTIDLEKYQIFIKDLTNGQSMIHEVVDEYHHYMVIAPSIRVIEASDEEILALPERTSQFSFLDNPEEDIYTNSDGSLL